jgi:hypothetical protein
VAGPFRLAAGAEAGAYKDMMFRFVHSKFSFCISEGSLKRLFKIACNILP